MERLTFRPKAEGVAYQHQIREERERYYAGFKNPWDGLDVDLKKAAVRPVSRAIAEKIIYEYEWLGTMVNTNLHYGIFWGDICGGVICIAAFGAGGAGAHWHMRYGIERRELGYLARGACAYWTPVGAGSKLISVAVRMLPPEIKVVQGFADTEAGEYGTIYQACNWLCLGRSKSSVEEFILPNGTIVNQRLITWFSRKHGLRFGEYKKYLIEHGCKKQRSNRKYIFCRILAKGKEYRRIYSNIEEMLTGYPKRPPIETGSAVQVE